MATADEYRHRAEQYWQLAKASTQLDAKHVILEVAEEFDKTAEEVERNPLYDRKPVFRSRILAVVDYLYAYPRKISWRSWSAHN